MKLIVECNEDVECLLEEQEGVKQYFIEGVFMQAEIPNRNRRMYPKSILFKEVDRYNEEYVKKRRSVGELGHPNSPKIIEERISHRVTSLTKDGNNIMGRAKLLDTPMGKIAKTLIDEGIKFGVSTRGLGSLKNNNGINEVQSDFSLGAIDIVHDPSAPDAFVEGIMEGKEWVLLGNGDIVEQIRKEIRETCSKDLERAKLIAFRKFLNELV